MARWTSSLQEIKHISNVSQQMPIGGIAEIILQDGTRIEGVIRRINQGNNAGQGGWKYYGEVEIETKDNNRRVIDYLDIKSANNIWSDEKAKEYEDLGLITIVK